jgi:hypothetical protein
MTFVVAPPVEAELERALKRFGVPVRRGDVLLATEAAYDGIVNREIALLGLESQIVRNRSELMVLPAGVTKGSGLLHALADMGLSQHSTVSIGDAENDHSLLDVCEFGVAVGNAVDALKARAEIVLHQPAGQGVAAFLRGPFMEGLPDVEQQRWRLTIGTYEDGSFATIPASRVSIAIQGPSGGGKSYFAGGLAEQLFGMRYTVCVLDLEGDHVALGDLHGAVTMGGVRPLPDPDELVTLLTHGLTSIILDLSLMEAATKRDYAKRVLNALQKSQWSTGIPHWIFLDEAHQVMDCDSSGWWCNDEPQPALCLATYRPDLLCRRLHERCEFLITLEAGLPATVARRSWEQVRQFVPAGRALPHHRHWHKYAEGTLPGHRRFFFRTARAMTGRTAGNLHEFAEEVQRASPDVLRHHAAHHDFSRWLFGLFGSSSIVSAVREIEAEIAAGNGAADMEALRGRLRQSVLPARAGPVGPN